MMHSGWVIVYVPGGNIYQMLDGNVGAKTSIRKRILKGTFKTVLTCVQLWWWIKS